VYICVYVYIHVYVYVCKWMYMDISGCNVCMCKCVLNPLSSITILPPHPLIPSQMYRDPLAWAPQNYTLLEERPLQFLVSDRVRDGRYTARIYHHYILYHIYTDKP
jgi:hypothetical protein